MKYSFEFEGVTYSSLSDRGRVVFEEYYRSRSITQVLKGSRAISVIAALGLSLLAIPTQMYV